MIKFNSDNIITGEIKQMLSSFNLPNATVLTGEETSYIPNRVYISGKTLYRSSLNGSSISEIPDYSYDFGDEIPGITHNLTIKSNLYDSYTHRYLGNCLRFIRDYKGINLMSMYNCFSNESPSKFNYQMLDTNGAHVFNIQDANHKLYMIPIRRGQIYTISLNTSRPCEIICGYYAHNEIVTMFNSTYECIRSCTPDSVVIYTKARDISIQNQPQLYQLEDNFYMFLKLPANYSSSIVVLEGDYRDSANVFINDSGYTEIKYIPSVIDENRVLHVSTPASRLQLLSCRGSQTYPFADKLLQYLYSNVICSGDVIVNNIKKLQKKLVDAGYSKYTFNPGVWTDELTAACLLCSYKNLKHREIYKDYDMIGFMDSDIENELGGLD